MKKLLIAAAVLALAGYHSTRNRVKVDSSRIVGHSASDIGHGIGETGAALERSGEQIDGRTPAQSVNNAVQQPY